MERKEAGIEKTMDRKEAGILVASTMRDVTQIVLESLKGQPFPDGADFEREFIKYRNWYLRMWNQTEKALDVPFKD